MANAIKNGNDSVTLKVGSETVDAVYLGDTLVYSGGTPPTPSYENEYFTTVALEQGMIAFNSEDNTLVYSTDSGSTWNTGNSVSVNEGDEILWKCYNPVIGSGIGRFSSTGNFTAEGNVMSLLYGDNFIGQTMLFNEYQFADLFFYCSGLVSAENLVLPTTTLTNNCYSSMFAGCINLTTAPSLPATTLADGCYEDMFNNCPSLNYIKCLATDISAAYCTDFWVDGVAASGTFVKAASMNDWTSGNNGIPSFWTVVNYSG